MPVHIPVPRVPRLAAVLLSLATACGGATGSRPAVTSPGKTPDARPRADRAPPDLGSVGTVVFPTSCQPSVQAELERAVAVLHSFYYEEARRLFEGVAERDPDCAMARWGVAMSYYHPLWIPPTADEFRAGLEAVERAEQAQAGSERERGYVAAIAAYYQAETSGAQSSDGEVVGVSCHGPGAVAAARERAIAYRDAMQQLHAAHPDDPEAAIFYALSLLGTASPTDRTLRNQLAAAEILERLAPAHPEHPGILHYLIHAYDEPELAERGLPAARAYAQIAPRIAHVQHMPSHIFTRLGLWEDSIRSNRKSAEAARAHEARFHPGDHHFEELHALDYLTYAYLQTAQDERAREIVDYVAGIRRYHPENVVAVAYAAGAIPARFALERRAYDEAAALELPPAPWWEEHPYAEAHVELARALGRARTGDVAGARRSLARLRALQAATTSAQAAYFRTHLDAQIEAVEGWIAHAEGDAGAATAHLARAADTEETLGKHPVTPGSILPIRELQADLLLALDRPADALEAYEASLARQPRRFLSVYGAAQAAERAERLDVALRHYRELLEIAGESTGARPELRQARDYVERHGSSAAAASERTVADVQ